MISFKKIVRFFSLTLPFLSLVGCGGGSGGTGQVSVSLTDASGPWKEVWVTVSEVDVHCSGGNWQTVATPDKTFNLLTLTNGVRVGLGLVDFPTGHCTQVRLILDPNTPDDGLNGLFKQHTSPNYAIDQSNNICPLALSSEDQTGIKLNHEFDVTTGRTDIVLDFDAGQSIVVEGNGTCRLKPVINISSTTEQANVSGKVVNGSAAGAALSGAQVSAQIPNPTSSDLKVIRGVPVITGADGAYKLLLEPNNYNIVAYEPGFTADVTSVTLAAGDDKTLDPLTLSTATDGTITGLVTITNSDADTFATLSFRTTVKGQLIEVTSVNVKNNTNYSVNLPPGTYTVEAFTFDQSLQTQVNKEFTGVAIGSTLNITF